MDMDEHVREIERRAEQAKGSRSCGSCNACCTIMAVGELHKPQRTKCCHLAERCTIYADRPASCRTFYCEWLVGDKLSSDERMRPDSIGLMFTRQYLPSIGYILEAWEVWPGAAREPRGRYLLDRLSKREAIVLLRDEGIQQKTVEWLCPMDMRHAIPTIDEVFKSSRVAMLTRSGAQLDKNYGERTGGAEMQSSD